VFRHRSVFEFYETEAAWLACGTVLNDFHGASSKTLGVEPFGQRLFGLCKRDVTYKQSVQSHLQKVSLLTMTTAHSDRYRMLSDSL
jgi:hypothetical protein